MKYKLLAFCLTFVLFGSVLAQTSDLSDAQSRLIHRADSLIAGYKFDQALTLLNRIEDPDLNVLLRLGLCNYTLGASQAAIRPYEKALQLDSTNVTAFNQLGLLYARAGDQENALTAFRRLIELDSLNSYYYKQAGDMALRMSEPVMAMRYFKKTLELNPSDTEASLSLGNVYMDMLEFARVDSIVQHGLSFDSRFAPLLLLRARSAFAQQQYESVITTVGDLLTTSDTTAMYARLLGVSYFNLRQYKNVVPCMNVLLREMYDYAWIYYYLGVSTRELGDASASVMWLKLAVQKSISENTRIYYAQLGQSFEEAGNYQEAIRAYRAAYDHSNDGILLYHLARNYDAYYKDKSTALKYYQKYLDSDDTTRLAKEYAKRRLQDEGIF